MHSIPAIPRCVVTGQHSGRSTIISDRTITNHFEPMPGLVISDIWVTDTMPVALNKRASPENTLFPNTPKNGSYFRYVFIPPDSEEKNSSKTEHLQQKSPHPLMHRTGSLEYVIILSGELYLILDEGETLLKPGDIVVQLGSHHAWSNRSDKPCVQVAILLDAKIENAV